MQNVHAPASKRVAQIRRIRDTPGLTMIAANTRSDRGRKPHATTSPCVTCLAAMSTTTKYSSTPVAITTRMRACSCSLSGRATSRARRAFRVKGNSMGADSASLALLIGEPLADRQNFLALARQYLDQLGVE